MTYFTTWDANVFLCLVSLGLPGDLAEDWTRKFKKVHNQFSLERDRLFHLRRWRRWRWVSKMGPYSSILREYKSKVEDIEPEDRYAYFEWAYENHYYTWSPKDLDWVKGFHPGRFFLMDHRRKEILEEIRDLESVGAWQEEKFIKKQNHIEDLLNEKCRMNC